MIKESCFFKSLVFMDHVETCWNRLQREWVGSNWAGEKYMRPRPGKVQDGASITIRNPYLSISPSAAQRLWLREKGSAKEIRERLWLCIRNTRKRLLHVQRSSFRYLWLQLGLNSPKASQMDPLSPSFHSISQYLLQSTCISFFAHRVARAYHICIILYSVQQRPFSICSPTQARAGHANKCRCQVMRLQVELFRESRESLCCGKRMQEIKTCVLSLSYSNWVIIQVSIYVLGRVLESNCFDVELGNHYTLVTWRCVPNLSKRRCCPFTQLRAALAWPAWSWSFSLLK